MYSLMMTEKGEIGIKHVCSTIGLTTAFIVLFPSICAPENRCEQLVAALTASLPAENTAEKTDAELDQATKTRPCLKTYPWPEGVFFTKTEEERAISADEMHELRDKVSSLIQDYSLLLKGDFDRTKLGFVIRTQEGWDHELLERFGALLLIWRLLPEGRYEEAIHEIDRVYSRWDIKARDSRWDRADHNTYFSRETQDNLFVLLRFLTLASIGSETRAEALSVAEEFARVRELLSDEISFLGDPTHEILSYTGCPSEVAK